MENTSLAYSFYLKSSLLILPKIALRRLERVFMSGGDWIQMNVSHARDPPAKLRGASCKQKWRPLIKLTLPVQNCLRINVAIFAIKRGSLLQKRAWRKVCTQPVG